MRSAAAIAASSSNAKRRRRRITYLLCMGFLLSGVQEKTQQCQQQQQQQQQQYCGSNRQTSWGIGGVLLLAHAQIIYFDNGQPSLSNSNGQIIYFDNGQPSNNLFADDEVSSDPPAPDPNDPGMVSSDISGYAFLDVNNDGLRDALTDFGIYDLSVDLHACAGDLVDTARTDTMGRYVFGELPVRDENGAEERYYVSIPEHPDYYALSSAWSGNPASPGADNVIDPATRRSDCMGLGAEEGETVASIGMVFDTSGPDTSKVSGFAFLDVDGDGLHDAVPDFGIYDLSVELFTCAGDFVGTTRTDTLGHYAFEDLPVSDENGAEERYYISVPRHPDYYSLSGAWSGSPALRLHSNKHPSVVDPATKRSDCFDLGERGAVASIGMIFYRSPMPSAPPTTHLSVTPSMPPAHTPSMTPTKLPSAPPTTHLSSPPSMLPTKAPSMTPTKISSLTPSATLQPTYRPRSVLTYHPSFLPSAPPTTHLSFPPSMLTTKIPSMTPTKLPSTPPTTHLSFPPSMLPTKAPSMTPNKLPSTPPTTHLSFPPSMLPTKAASMTPTKLPSLTPSAPLQPTYRPTSVSTYHPSFPPSMSWPTYFPTTPYPMFSPTTSHFPTSTPIMPPRPSPRPSRLSTATPSSPPTRTGEVRGPVITKGVSMILNGIEVLPDAEAWIAATTDYIEAYFDGAAADDPVFNVTATIEGLAQRSSSEVMNGIIQEYVENDGGRRRLRQQHGGEYYQRYSEADTEERRGEGHQYRWQGPRQLSTDKWVEVTYDQKSTYKISFSHVNDDKYDDIYVATTPFAEANASSAYLERLRTVSPIYDAVTTVNVSVFGEAAVPVKGAKDGDDAGNTDGGGENTEKDRTSTYIIVGAVCAVLLLAAVLFMPDLRRRMKKRGAEEVPAEISPSLSVPLQERGAEEVPAEIIPSLSVPQQATSPTTANMVDVIAPAGKLGVSIERPRGGGPAYVCDVSSASPLLGEIQLGDKIVAVDDEDVQDWTATNVSNLLLDKNENTRRKITVLRETKTVT